MSDRDHPTRTATLTGSVLGVAFSPDGRTLATASNDNTAGLWDLTDRAHPTRTATVTGHTGSVLGVAFSPDGHTLATASEDGTAGLWDLTDRAHPSRTATLTGGPTPCQGRPSSPCRGWRSARWPYPGHHQLHQLRQHRRAVGSPWDP